MTMGPNPNKSQTTSADGSRTRSWLDKADYRLHKLENRRPKKIEVPWFIGTGYFHATTHDLVVDEWWDGSYASSNVDAAIWPDIMGIWQVTFSWSLLVGQTIGPYIIASVDIFSDMRREMPSSYAHSHINQMTGAFWAGPDDDQEFVAGVGSGVDLSASAGRIVGQLVAPSPPVGST